MIALDANEIALVSIGAIAAGFWGVIKASGTEIGKRVATKVKQKVHHALKVDSVCPGDEALMAVSKIADSVNEILAQVRPNGGGSIKDVVGQTKKLLSEISVEMKHQRIAQEITADAAGLMIMRADGNGRVTWVSKSIRERFGAIDEGAYLGWSWLNRVHPDDRDRTRERWEQAIEDRCELQDEYRICAEGGLIANVVDTSKPVWCNNEVVGWYCLLRVVSYVKNQEVKNVPA